MSLIDTIDPKQRLFPEDLSYEMIADMVLRLRACGDGHVAAIIAALAEACRYALIDIGSLLERGFDTNLADCDMDGVRNTIKELAAITGERLDKDEEDNE